MTVATAAAAIPAMPAGQAASAAAATPAAPVAAGAPRFVRPFLIALWQRAPQVGVLPPEQSRAVLRDGWLLLPCARKHGVSSGPASRHALQQAAAAHAGAHLTYGGEPFERQTLKPVQIALLGLLEDARVEWHAARDLPGLRPLWLAHHGADAESGNGFETLMARAARNLLDPRYLDPHPWVQKVRSLFFADGEGRRLALNEPAGLRWAASLLGNDIGQMRLQFNAHLYRVAPEYRDDNGHLWREDPQSAQSAQSAQSSSDAVVLQAAGREHPDEGTLSREALLAIYPEWDRLIGRMRRDWVRLYEAPKTSHRVGGEVEPLPAAVDEAAVRQLRSALDSHAAVSHKLRNSLSVALGNSARAHRCRGLDGDTLHLDALLAARIDQRGRRPPDERIYLRPNTHTEALSVIVLLDASASTARPAAVPGSSVLQVARLASLLIAGAIESAGHECAVEAFASNGRHEVVVHPVKRFEDRCGDRAVMLRASALRSRWSTRLGALVRHAAAGLRQRTAERRVVMLLTDGEPHDIDVHDARYLIEDLRHAVHEAACEGLAVVCLDLDGARWDPRREAMRKVFARGAYRRLPRLDRLPAEAAAALRRT